MGGNYREFFYANSKKYNPVFLITKDNNNIYSIKEGIGFGEICSKYTDKGCLVHDITDIYYFCRIGFRIDEINN